jgi:plastocyanin
MTLDRRDLLRATAVVLAGSLAGCTGGGGGGDGGAEQDSPTDAGGSGGSDADETVVVGPGGSLSFDPAELSVDAGATITWEWDSDGHTVTPTDIPDGSDWEGTGSETHDGGYTHTHTFETEGVFDYVCEPHQGSGMVGTIEVGDVSGSGSGETDSPTPTDGGDGSSGDGDDDSYY